MTPFPPLLTALASLFTLRFAQCEQVWPASSTLYDHMALQAQAVVWARDAEPTLIKRLALDRLAEWRQLQLRDPRVILIRDVEMKAMKEVGEENYVSHRQQWLEANCLEDKAAHEQIIALWQSLCEAPDSHSEAPFSHLCDMRF